MLKKRTISFLAISTIVLSLVMLLYLAKGLLENQTLRTISEHPEAIVRSVQNYKEKKQADADRLVRETFFSLHKDGALTAGSPKQGSSKEDIILIEFSDFQCPACFQAYGDIKQFMSQHGRSITLVYKHFPLSQIHPEAMPAAKASWAAGQQGKFWQYHHALFDNQKELGEQLYTRIANSLNLDVKKFDGDRSSERASAAVRSDMELGKKFDVNGTPFVILNGDVIQPSKSSLEESFKRVSAGKSS
jgi:protein-disulfide isomerase